MVLTIIIFIIIGVVVSSMINKSKEKSIKLEQEPFGKKYKVLVDALGTHLWGGEKFILMKKNERQYFIQKSKLPNNESHIYIVNRKNTLNLDFYEKVAGITVKYSKNYDISDSSTINQNTIAKDFASSVRLLGKMEY